MKRILTALFLLSTSNLYSQVLPVWRYDNTLINPLVVSTDIAYDGQNTFVTTQDFDQLQSTYIQKLNYLGNLIHADTIQYSYSICDNRMVRDKAGSVYICGQKDSAFTDSKIKLVKLDSSLNVIWSYTAVDSIPTDYYSPRIHYSSDENKIYIICQKSHINGVSVAILKFDTNGNMIWESDSIPNLGLNCIRFTNDSRGNIILGGFVDVPGTDEDFTIIKVDTSGSISWDITMNNPLDDRVEDIVTDNSDNIYAFGYFSDAISSRVVKYDSNGNFVWMKSIAGFWGTKLTVDNSGVYVAGVDSSSNKLVVAKLDSAGNIFGLTTVNQSASGIISAKLNNQSQLYVCYTTDSAGEYQWAVSKFDSSINTNWTFNYPDTNPVFAYPSSFLLLEDGFIVGGKIDPYISTVRFDETTITQVEDRPSSDLIYWPNPAGRLLYFENKINSCKKINFKLFDVDSRCVFENSSSSTNSNYRLVIELPDLKKGIYFFGLWIDGKYYSDKLIIM